MRRKNSTSLKMANGQPIHRASITIAAEPPVRIKSDEYGKYRVGLPPGRYKIFVSADNYLDAVIDTVEVKAGETSDGTVVLATKSQITKVDVQETVTPVASRP